MNAPTPIRIKLKPRKALPFFSGHPWVFAGALEQENQDLPAGTEVLLVSEKNQPIAWGLYNPKSAIRVRLYQWQVEEQFTDQFWQHRIVSSLQRRENLLKNSLDKSCRLIFSEGDGLSGLTVDRFGEFLVIQLTSLALSLKLPCILETLEKLCHPQGIILRTEKGMTDEEGLELRDGLLTGKYPEEPLIIQEHGVKYLVDITQGQKTGFYFDQRANRLTAATYAPAGTMLDVCSYSGGFSLNGLINGQIIHATCVDSSEAALTLVQKNAQLNNLSDKIHVIQGRGDQVMRQLHADGQQFNTVILDPPKLARQRSGIKKALQAYEQLNRQAIKLVAPGGLLVTCSCSGLVSKNEFLEAVTRAGVQEHRQLRMIDFRGQAWDHPVSLNCPESAYLKCAFLQVE